MVSNIYYVIADDSAQVAGLVVRGFTRNNRAESYAKTAKNAQIIRHSKVALSRLSMALLMKIVRTGRPDIKVTQLDRDSLVTAAHGCLWAASISTSKLDVHPDDSRAQRNREILEMAKNKGGSAATEAAPTKVRDMRAGTAAAGEAKAPKEPKVAKPKAEPKPDEYAGKKIYLVGKENPRREGTHGHRSMEVVRNKPGVTFEDYIAGGGRRVDLKGSIELKQVELK